MVIEKCDIPDCLNNAVCRAGIERPHTLELIKLCERHRKAYLALPDFCDLRSHLDAAEAQTQ